MTILRRATSARRMAMLGSALASASSAMAAPFQEELATWLEKRKPVLSDSDSLTADGKVPLDAILLIGIALGFALICMLISVWNVRFPGSSNARIVIEERARARTELRLRGGGSRRGSDMATLLSSPGGSTQRKSHRFPLSSRASSQTLDSKTHLIVGHGHAGNDMYFQKAASHMRPKLAHDRTTSTSRASRGYSVYSTKDMPRRPGMNTRDSTVLNVPTLISAESDSHASSSLSSSSASRDLEASSPPPHARPQMQSRPTNGSMNRISTSLGAGVDLARHRSLGRENSVGKYPSLEARRSQRGPAGPRPIEASRDRLSPSKDARVSRSVDHSHQTLAPQDTRMSHSSGSSQGRSPNSRGGSSQSVGHDMRPTSYFEGAASDEAFHTPVQQHPLLPRSPPNAERRSRPLAYYENQDQTDSSAAQHFTRLLESPGARQYGRHG